MAEQSRSPRAGELDELTLLRAQRGETAALRALVQHHQRAVFALHSRMIGFGAAGVEDLAQETFLRVLRGLPRFRLDGPARLSTWVLTIATRLAIDELRRPERDRTRTLPLDAARELAGSSRADAALEQRTIGEALARAVNALSPEFRAVFLLREVHELDYEEIARALDVDLGTVKSRLSRARGLLRAALTEVRP